VKAALLSSFVVLFGWVTLGEGLSEQIWQPSTFGVDGPSDSQRIIDWRQLGGPTVDVWGCKIRLPDGFVDVSSRAEGRRVFHRSEGDLARRDELFVGPEDRKELDNRKKLVRGMVSLSIARQGELVQTKSVMAIGLKPTLHYLISLSDGMESLSVMSDEPFDEMQIVNQCWKFAQAPREVLISESRSVEEAVRSGPKELKPDTGER
jgi:hypothetical protein